MNRLTEKDRQDLAAMAVVMEALEFYAEENDERIDVSDGSDYLTDNAVFVMKYGGKKFMVTVSSNMRQD